MANLTKQKKLTNKQLTLLDNFLKQHDLHNVAFIHGFLTAIVSAPDLIMPSEWYPYVFGDEGLEWFCCISNNPKTISLPSK